MDRERRRNCKAYQSNGEMRCPRCGLQWDVKDDDPPACLTKEQYSLKKLAELKRLVE